MGIVLQTLGHVSRAVEAYGVALKVDPTYAIAHYNLGVALQSQQRLDEAINSYETAVKHRPHYWNDAYNNMSASSSNIECSLQSKGDYQAAMVKARSMSAPCANNMRGCVTPATSYAPKSCPAA